MKNWERKKSSKTSKIGSFWALFCALRKFPQKVVLDKRKIFFGQKFYMYLVSFLLKILFIYCNLEQKIKNKSKKNWLDTCKFRIFGQRKSYVCLKQLFWGIFDNFIVFFSDWNYHIDSFWCDKTDVFLIIRVINLTIFEALKIEIFNGFLGCENPNFSGIFVASCDIDFLSVFFWIFLKKKMRK